MSFRSNGHPNRSGCTPTRVALLEQVAVNLLNNADEGGRIKLTVRQEGDDMALRVRDTGIGIAPELLGGVFALFTPANRSLDGTQGAWGSGCL